MDSIKNCRSCRRYKTIDQFYKTPTGKYGVRGVCKKCFLKLLREWRENNYQRTRARERKYESTRKQLICHRSILSRYKLTEEQYKNIFIEHEYKCATCGREHLSPQSLCIDHDHKNGNIRGLLCSPCNRIIGFARENINILKNLIQYLEKYNSKEMKNEKTVSLS